MNVLAPPGYDWVPDRLDTLNLEEAISLRTRLELELCLLPVCRLTTPEEQNYWPSVDKAYRQIIPRLVPLFVFMDGYPFDFLRQVEPSRGRYEVNAVYVLLLDRKVVIFLRQLF